MWSFILTDSSCYLRLQKKLGKKHATTFHVSFVLLHIKVLSFIDFQQTKRDALSNGAKHVPEFRRSNVARGQGGNCQKTH